MLPSAVPAAGNNIRRFLEAIGGHLGDIDLALLFAVAFLADYLPARRAAKLDPVIALSRA